MWHSHSHFVPTGVPGYHWRCYCELVLLTRVRSQNIAYLLWLLCHPPLSLIFRSSPNRQVATCERYSSSAVSNVSSGEVIVSHLCIRLVLRCLVIVHYSLMPWYYTVTPLGLIDAAVWEISIRWGDSWYGAEGRETLGGFFESYKERASVWGMKRGWGENEKLPTERERESEKETDDEWERKKEPQVRRTKGEKKRGD